MRSASTKLMGAMSRGMATHAGRAGESVIAVDAKHTISGVIDVPQRLLMGPGPANAHPRILAAQSLPLLGHMHPPFLHIMDEIQEGLRYTMQTDQKHCLLISGTGHAGMEAAIANLVEPGDKVLVGNSGIWGERVADMSRRFRGDVVEVKAPLGSTIAYEDLKKALEEHKPALLFLCQGESSTGTHQSLAGLGELCKKTGTLLLVDAVCSLGGVPLFADQWGIDAIYSGSQKCLSAPPGASPFFLSDRAMEKVLKRKTKPATYNLDINLIGDYWGWREVEGVSGPVSTFYAMREALAIVTEEGLEPMWKRHLDCHNLLWDGLHSLGLKPFVEKAEDRLITVNTIKVPEGVDFAALIKNAMDKYNVEIAGGFGPSAGKVWRVGIMGNNAKPANIISVAWDPLLARCGVWESWATMPSLPTWRW
eukprot:gene6579-3231_t